MFNLIDQNHAYPWDIELPVPLPDGKVGKAKVQVFFQYLDDVELLAVINRLMPEKDNTGITELKAWQEYQLLKRVMTAWKDVGDADGKPLELNDDNLIKFCRFGRYREIFVEQYQEFRELRLEKNSETSSATG